MQFVVLTDYLMSSMEETQPQMPLLPILSKIRRQSRIKCSVCEKNFVCHSYFRKCPECTTAEDAKDHWFEFKINADIKPAHVTHNELCEYINHKKT